MAEIVLGVGTSHSPLLAIPAEMWLDRAKDDLRKAELYLADGRIVSYSELNAEVAGAYAAKATPEHFLEQHKQAQDALHRLAQAIETAAPDVVIVIGDDQNELFGMSHLPAMAVYSGREIVTHPKNEVNADLPDWYRTANESYMMDTVHTHPAAAEFASVLIDGLIETGVDVSVASEVTDPRAAGFGHAYGFVIDRLLGGRQVPVLPIMLNTYFPPNVPRPARCYDIGVTIGKVVAASDLPLRVAVVASGGLSHFAVDERLDRGILGAMAGRDADALRAVSHLALRSGNSEILNWIMTAGAVGDLAVDQCDYIPVQRTPAGTGIGLAFVTWTPPADRR